MSRGRKVSVIPKEGYAGAARLSPIFTRRTPWAPPRGGPSPPPGNGCSTSNRPTAPGAPNWKATRSWRARRSCCGPFWAWSNAAGPPCGRLPDREAASRRRLGDVSRRRRGDQRQRQGLLRPEADRPRPQRRVHGAGPAGDPGPRRRRRGQQFHALLPGPVGPDFLCPVSGRSARDGAVAQVVSGEPLRRQFLVADDHRAVVDHLGDAAGAADRAGARHPRVVSARSRGIGRRCVVRG